MATVLTVGLRNKSTQPIHILLSTTRLITVPPSTLAEDLTVVEFNQTEANAWAKTIETPVVAAWLASFELVIKPLPNPETQGTSQCEI